MPNILTDSEKKNIIDHHINMEKRSRERRMLEMHYLPQQIEAKFKEIDWIAEIDSETIIRQANERKHWQLEELAEREENKKRKEAERKEILKEWDANKFYNQIKRHFILKHGNFISDANAAYLKSICFFISNDSRFETELGYSFNKGLLIQGSAGLGKTETIRAISENPLWPVTIISILEIAETVKQTGECLLNTNRMLCIDDAGTEPEIINHYGTKINWFKDFIETYYLNNKTFSGLIVTTNLGAKEIEDRYGYRVRSRCREMFNLIQLTGKDLRK